jgi:hypothetical protein
MKFDFTDYGMIDKLFDYPFAIEMKAEPEINKN